MQRMNFYLTEQQRKLLEQMAKKTGLSVAELVRRAVDEYITTQKGK